MMNIMIPDFENEPDKNFVAFATLLAVGFNSALAGETQLREVIYAAWAMTRPGVTFEVVPFSRELNVAFGERPDLLTALGQPAGTFRAAGIRVRRPDGSMLVEMLCVGHTNPPSDNDGLDDATETEINAVIARAAAETGFVASPEALEGEWFDSNGMTRALRGELEHHIDQEAEKFRQELNEVFKTWKGGDDQ